MSDPESATGSCHQLGHETLHLQQGNTCLLVTNWSLDEDICQLYLYIPFKNHQTFRNSILLVKFALASSSRQCWYFPLYLFPLFFFTSQIAGLQKRYSSHLPTNTDSLEKQKKEKGHYSKMLLLPTYALLEPEWCIPLWNCSFILTGILRVWKEGRIFKRCYRCLEPLNYTS